MSGSWNYSEFPRLTAADYQVTSPATRKYNCIAWSVDATDAKWWPDPLGIGRWPRWRRSGARLDPAVECARAQDRAGQLAVGRLANVVVHLENPGFKLAISSGCQKCVAISRGSKAPVRNETICIGCRDHGYTPELSLDAK